MSRDRERDGDTVHVAASDLARVASLNLPAASKLRSALRARVANSGSAAETERHPCHPLCPYPFAVAQHADAGSGRSGVCDLRDASADALPCANPHVLASDFRSLPPSVLAVIVMNPFWKGGSRRDPSESSETMANMEPPAQRRWLTVVPDGLPQATELADTPIVPEAEMLRARALRLLAIGVGDHTPAEVREQVAAIARRLAELEPGAPVEWH
jgi:hypothetical protein